MKRLNSLHHKHKPNFSKGRRKNTQTLGELTPVLLLVLLGVRSGARRWSVRLGAFGLQFLGGFLAVLLNWLLLFLFGGGLSPVEILQHKVSNDHSHEIAHIHSGSETVTSPHLVAVFCPVEMRFSPDALLDPVLSSASFLESFLNGSLLT